MKRPKLPRDPMARAFAVGEQSTAEPAEGAAELATAFWEETGVIAPMVEIKPPLTDRWGEDERWRLWREWIERRKMGETGGRRAASARGGKKGGPARAAKLSPERRREIARAAAKARWSKKAP